MKRVVRAAVAAIVVCCTGLAWAEDTQVETSRGLTRDRPYAISYPVFMKLGGGSGTAVATLDLQEAAMGLPAGSVQAELHIIPNAPARTPEQAKAAFNAEAVTAEWRKTFPDFTFGRVGITEIRSGDALIYNGTLTSKAAGGPKLMLVRAEATDGGRLYRLDFYIDHASYEASRDLVGFIVANFSTKSEPGCCNDPSPLP
jgi:hypothetical protein